jgi:hypothetical protein
MNAFCAVGWTRERRDQDLNDEMTKQKHNEILADVSSEGVAPTTPSFTSRTAADHGGDLGTEGENKLVEENRRLEQDHKNMQVEVNTLRQQLHAATTACDDSNVSATHLACSLPPTCAVRCPLGRRALPVRLSECYGTHNIEGFDRLRRESPSMGVRCP